MLLFVIVVLALHPGETLTLEQLRAFCKKELANYKLPTGMKVRSVQMSFKLEAYEIRWELAQKPHIYTHTHIYIYVCALSNPMACRLWTQFLATLWERWTKRSSSSLWSPLHRFVWIISYIPSIFCFSVFHFHQANKYYIVSILSRANSRDRTSFT